MPLSERKGEAMKVSISFLINILIGVLVTVLYHFFICKHNFVSLISTMVFLSYMIYYIHLTAESKAKALKKEDE